MTKDEFCLSLRLLGFTRRLELPRSGETWKKEKIQVWINPDPLSGFSDNYWIKILYRKKSNFVTGTWQKYDKAMEALQNILDEAQNE